MFFPCIWQSSEDSVTHGRRWYKLLPWADGWNANKHNFEGGNFVLSIKAVKAHNLEPSVSLLQMYLTDLLTFVQKRSLHFLQKRCMCEYIYF